MNKELRIVGACDHNRVIGKNGQLPWEIYEDLEHFRKETEGTCVVVGRKTFENVFKNIQEYQREFIVLTTTKEYKEYKVATSVRDAIQKAESNQVNFVGGQNVFHYARHQVDEIKLSIIHDIYKGDRFFPKLNRDLWKVESVEDYPLDKTAFSVYTLVRNNLEFKENFESQFAVPDFIRTDSI